VPAVGCGHAFGCRRGPGLHTGGDRCAAVGCDCLLCVWGGAGLVTVCQTFVLFGQGTQTWAVACAQACLNRGIAAPIHSSQISRAILAGSMPCQANNACASSHHCSNGIIAMLPKTQSVWRKANTDDALVVGRLSPAASFWRTPLRRPRADDIGVRIGPQADDSHTGTLRSRNTGRGFQGLL
jgi:hypothetical protein